MDNAIWLTVHPICLACHMAPTQHIQQPVVVAILSKMGIICSAARKLLFGSAPYCSMGLDHLSTIRNVSRLQYIIVPNRCKRIANKSIHQQLD
jgi:hypothetical protein